MRLFVAIDLTDAARARIAAEQRRLERAAAASLRWVRQDQLHLTLAFVADLAPSRAEELAGGIRRGFAVPAFDLCFSGLGVLPDVRHPRVLYLHVSGGSEAVVALQQAVAERLAEHEVGLEGRPFRPHLTLARWRDSRSGDARGVLDAGATVVVRHRVTEVRLYESRISANGATHLRLATGPVGR